MTNIRFHNQAHRTGGHGRRAISLGSPSNTSFFGFEFDTTDREDWADMNAFDASDLGISERMHRAF